jgi:protein-disulfide isomerase/uncharacterized membrane protein
MLNKARLVALAGLSTAGIAISAYLTGIHLAFLRTGLPSACNINDTLNCDAVNNSAWSELLGVPVSHLGMIFFFAVLITALMARRGGRLAERAHAWLLLAALGATLFSAYLAYVALFRVHALCLFCLGLDAVTVAVLGVLLPGGLAALRSFGAGLPQDERALRQPASAVVIFLLAAFMSSWVLRSRLSELRQHPAAPVATSAASAGTPAPPPDGGAGKPPELPAHIDLDSKTAPSMGPPNAKVTIVEISDFECPFCQRAAATMKEVLAAYPGQIRVVFRHFPLDQACNPLLKRPVHENACAAARAAVCAQGRGKFWPLAEKLFEGNTDPEDRRAALRELHLDDAEQRACEESPATAAVVAADIAAVSKAGITAVPVFLINGRPLRGARPLADFQRIIDEELHAAGK